MRPRSVRLLILGSLLLGCHNVFACQEAKTKAGAPAGQPDAAPVDPRYRSPRATVRTFLIAMNLTEDDPRRIDDAIACLDLSGMPTDHRGGGRFAFELEFVFRSTNIPTYVITDLAEGSECEIGEGKDIKLRLHRLADGRWLFEGRTLQDLPKMRLLLWERAVAAGQGKDAGDVPADFRSPYATFRTYIEALEEGEPRQGGRVPRP